MLTLCWFLQVSVYLFWGKEQGREMVPTRFFVLRDVSQCTHSEVNKQISLPYIPRVFQTAAPILFLNGALLCFFKNGDSTLSALSELIFKFTGVKPH